MVRFILTTTVLLLYSQTAFSEETLVQCENVTEKSYSELWHPNANAEKDKEIFRGGGPPWRFSFNEKKSDISPHLFLSNNALRQSSGEFIYGACRYNIPAKFSSPSEINATCKVKAMNTNFVDVIANRSEGTIALYFGWSFEGKTKFHTRITGTECAALPKKF